MILSDTQKRRPGVRAIDTMLPQTQCTRCGYPRCRDYARAIARGEAEINRCPPGGDETIVALAQLTGRVALALDPECGQHQPRRRAWIDEALCIGCTKCIQACPVDAIVGSAKVMHSVLARECTGCELCLAPCPVDCILMVGDIARTPGKLWPEYNEEDAFRSRRRVVARLRRLERIRRQRARRDVVRQNAARAVPEAYKAQAIRDEIRAAVARSRARRGPAR